MNDTGLNIPESLETLRAQQRQLLDGRRLAQMFPLRSAELPLPVGFERVVTDRGVFHFNPAMVSKDDVRVLSGVRRENVLLGLGPYNKADIMEMFRNGEPLLVVTERHPNGIEVKAALGTPTTAPRQLGALEQSKTPGNIVAVEGIATFLTGRISQGINHG